MKCLYLLIVCLCIFLPATPSWPSSTDPRLPWGDTSLKLSYMLSGKHTSQCRGCMFFHLPHETLDLVHWTSELFHFLCRNDSVVIKYELTFVLPEEQQEELRNFTLSREMVYNVFRQFLYEQDPVESGMTYIDPVSLKMSSANWWQMFTKKCDTEQTQWHNFTKYKLSSRWLLLLITCQKSICMIPHIHLWDFAMSLHIQ